MTTVVIGTREVVIMDQEELRKANLRMHIRGYEQQAVDALEKYSTAGAGLKSSYWKNYVFAMSSALRLTDLLGENAQ